MDGKKEPEGRMRCASQGCVDHLYCLLQLNHRHGSGAAAMQSFVDGFKNDYSLPKC